MRAAALANVTAPPSRRRACNASGTALSFPTDGTGVVTIDGAHATISSESLPVTAMICGDEGS